MAKRAGYSGLKLIDTSRLTNGDWAEINKFEDAWENGGAEALSKAIDELANADPLRAPGKPAGGSRCKFCTLKM
jgi:hypothetical protein